MRYRLGFDHNAPFCILPQKSTKLATTVYEKGDINAVGQWEERKVWLPSLLLPVCYKAHHLAYSTFCKHWKSKCCHYCYQRETHKIFMEGTVCFGQGHQYPYNTMSRADPESSCILGQGQCRVLHQAFRAGHLFRNTERITLCTIWTTTIFRL